MTKTYEPLVDSLGRVHTNLRISVTDRCNLRCFYCMPEDVVFKPRDEILSYEEITRVVAALAPLGVNKLRLTGGEPLVRSGLQHLIANLKQIEGIDDIALTTNGILLTEQAQALYDAGLDRLNISLDTLDDEVFEKLSRRRGIERVLAGIDAARKLPFRKIRLNAVSIKNLTEQEIVPLGRYARERKIELRFIEFMPLDADGNWDLEQVLPGQEIRRILEEEFSPLRPVDRDEPSQPATTFEYVDGGGRIGFINPVTEPFCSSCNRLRMTAEGKIRNCLFSQVEWDLSEILRRASSSDEELIACVREALAAKKPGHGIDSPDFVQPSRPMYEIGG
jgi:cyclic pyranopterin phosphate synthase